MSDAAATGRTTEMEGLVAILTDPRAIAAAISALAALLVAAVGWIIAHRRDVAAEARREAAARREVRRLRRQRRRDMTTALAAEVYANLVLLQSADLESHAETVATRMRAEPDFVPFVPRERNDALFQALVGEIHLLDADVVARATLYYSQLAAIGMMVEDMRSPGYRALPAKRRAAIFSDYVEMKIEARTLARTVLNAVGKGWPEAAARSAGGEAATPAEGSVAGIGPGAPRDGGNGQ